MGAGAGRNLKLKRGVFDDVGGTWDYTTIAGVRSKNFTVNSEPIDVTSDDDTGIRTLLEDANGALEPSSRSIDASVSGVTKDEQLIAAALNGTDLLTQYELELPSGATIVGKFALTSLEITGEYQDAVTFSGSLQSSGEWTYTPAP